MHRRSATALMGALCTVLATGLSLLAAAPATADDPDLPNTEYGTWLALQSTGVSSDLSLREPGVLPGEQPWQRLATARITGWHNQWFGANDPQKPMVTQELMRGSAIIASPVPAGETVGVRFGFGHLVGTGCVLDSSFEKTATSIAGAELTTVATEYARPWVAKDCGRVELFDPTSGRVFDALTGTLMFWSGSPAVATPGQPGRAAVTAYSTMGSHTAGLPEQIEPWQRITSARLVVVGEQLQARVQVAGPVPAGRGVQLRVGIGVWHHGTCLPRAWADQQLVGGSFSRALTIGQIKRRTDWTCAVAKTSEKETPTQPYDEVTGLLVHRATNSGRLAAQVMGKGLIKRGAWTSVKVKVRDVNGPSDRISVRGSGADLKVRGATTSKAKVDVVTLRVLAQRPGRHELRLVMVDSGATVTQTLNLTAR